MKGSSARQSRRDRDRDSEDRLPNLVLRPPQLPVSHMALGSADFGHGGHHAFLRGFIFFLVHDGPDESSSIDFERNFFSFNTSPISSRTYISTSSSTEST